MTSPIVRSMVLWIPDWPITAYRRHSQAMAAGGGVEAVLRRGDAPLALVDRGTVFACSTAARAEGVKRGSKVREAQARCPDLLVVPYDQQVDSRGFETVVAAIHELLPGVQIMRPGLAVIRSRGPGRYYGGEAPAALALLGLLGELGIQDARVGVADGPFTAEQAAKTTSEVARFQVVTAGASAAFLAPLPVRFLDDAALTTLLARLGIRTLAEFASLDAVDVLGRFGQHGAYLHALSGGLDSRPIVPHIPPEELDVSIAFEPPLDRVDQVTFGVRASADDFIQRLVAEHLVCTALRVEIDAERGEFSERSWLHPRSFTAADVVDRVRWQLQGSGEIDAGLRSGVSAVRLVPEAVDAIAHHEVGLFGAGPDERIHSGLSRVQSMLGHTGVMVPVISGGRTLADRQGMAPWGDRPVVLRRAGEPWPGQLPRPAPSTVFPHPHPVQVSGANGEEVEVDARGVLSSPPVRFSPLGSGKSIRTITSWAGPWPVVERWWDAESARRVNRFQVVDSEGSAWLLVLEGTAWSAEARYD